LQRCTPRSVARHRGILREVDASRLPDAGGSGDRVTA
jgi:hypothetical protein